MKSGRRDSRKIDSRTISISLLKRLAHHGGSAPIDHGRPRPSHGDQEDDASARCAMAGSRDISPSRHGRGRYRTVSPLYRTRLACGSAGRGLDGPDALDWPVFAN